VPEKDGYKAIVRSRVHLWRWLVVCSILGSVMSPMNTSAQENEAKGPLGFAYKSATPILPYLFELPWDVSKFPSVVTQEFKVTEYYPYNFFLRFMPPHIPMGLPTFHEMQKFTGDGSYGPYDTKNRKWVTWRTTEEEKQAFAGIESGKYEGRYGHPGTRIPVHLKIERLGTSNGNPVVIDKTFDTGSTAGGYKGGLQRTIGYVKLKPGKYRLTASTLQPTTLPPDIVATFLDVMTPPDTNPLSDNQ
jgi:uncharacterized protein DUF5625